MSEQYLQSGFLFDAPTQKKQEFLIFSVMVAGKSADRTWKVVKNFLAIHDPENPFKTVQWMIDNGRLNECLEEARTGQYSRLRKTLPELIKVDPEDVTIEQLEDIHGIGKKTSRFYKLYTDSDFKGIPLDTHLLKFLNDIGYDAPKTTPQSNKRYKELEQKLIELYEVQKDTYGLDTLQKFDYHIWYNYNKDNKQKYFMIKTFKNFKDKLN